MNRYFTETEKATILDRNKRLIDDHKRKMIERRRLAEDRKLAKEYGLTLEEIRNERDSQSGG